MAIRDRLVPRYLKNAGRSMLYATGDILKDWSPVLMDFAESAKDTVSDSYASIKEFVFKRNDKDETVFQEGKSVVKQIFKNSLEDLKTGNWYNKSRDEQFEKDMMSAMGFDFGDFDNLVGDDWGEDDFGSSSASSDSELSTDAKAQISSEQQSTTATIRAMDAVGAGVASSINNGLTSSSNYIVKSTQHMLSSIHNLNKTGFAQVSSSVAGLNKTFTEFATMISKPLSDHMRNSTEHYIKTEKSIGEIKSLLEKIVANNAGGEYDKHLNNKSKKRTMADFMSGGAFDLRSYKDYVSEQLKDSMSIVTSMFDMMGGRQGLASMGRNFSIPKAALKYGIKKVIPEYFETQLKNFGEQFGYATMNAFKKLSLSNGSKISGKFGGLGGILFDFFKDNFIPKEIYNDKIDTSKYHQGPLPWDGQAKKALTEVIPTTLLKIYSAITGGDDLTYDYSAGKFKKRTDIASEFKKRENLSIAYAGGTLRADLLKEGFNVDQVDAFFRSMLKDTNGKEGDTKGRNIFEISKKQLDLENDQKVKDICERYGILDDAEGRRMLRRMQALLAEGNYNQFQAELALEKARVTARTETESLSGTSIYADNNNNLFNGRGRRVVAGSHEKTKSQSNATTGADTSSDDNTSSSNTLLLNYKTEEEIRSIKRELKREGKTDAQIEEYLKEHGIAQKTGYDSRNKSLLGGILSDDKYKDTSIGKLAAAWSSKSNILSPSLNFAFDSVGEFFRLVTDSFNEFFWGDEKDKTAKEKLKGFFGKLGDRLNDISKEVFGWDEGIKDKLKGFWTDTKASLANIGKSAVNDAKTVWSGAKTGFADQRYVNNLSQEEINIITAKYKLDSSSEDYIHELAEAHKRYTYEQAEQEKAANDWTEAGGTMAYGAREITKTGIAAVSKGEMIIPSDYNPNYHGSNNKAAQLRNERRALGKFYGFYNEGGKVGDKLNNFGNKIGRGGANFLKNTQDLAIETGQKMSDNAAAIREKRLSRMYHNYDANNNTTVKDKIRNAQLTKIIGQDLKQARGNMGAGGILGLIGGTMLGVGPLGGAILGSAIGFVTKSNGMQKFLFGDTETDENGNIKVKGDNGLLGKGLSEFLLNNSKAIGKGSLAGGLLGMITPLGPVAGAVAGAALGFVTKSEKAKEFLFGKIDEKTGQRMGGLFSKKFQERFKGKNLARIGLGAAAGAFFGPAGGLFTNMILGAGVGLLTTTNSVQRFLFGGKKKNMFGKEVDVEGLLPMLKRLTIDNIVGIGMNLKNRLTNGIKDIVDAARRRINRRRERLEERLARSELVQRFRDTGLGKAIGGARQWLRDRNTTLLREAAFLPFRIVTSPLSLINAHNSRRALMHGDMVYDSRLRRNLSAGERMQRRGRWWNKNLGDDVYANTDTAISQIINDPNLSATEKSNRIEQIKSQLSAASESDSEISGETHEMRMGLYNDLHDLLGDKKFGRFAGNGLSLNRVVKSISNYKNIEDSPEYQRIAATDPETAEKFKSIVNKYRSQNTALVADNARKTNAFKDALGIGRNRNLKSGQYRRINDLLSNEQDLLKSKIAEEDAANAAKTGTRVNAIVEKMNTTGIPVYIVSGSSGNSGDAASAVNGESDDNSASESLSPEAARKGKAARKAKKEQNRHDRIAKDQGLEKESNNKYYKVENGVKLYYTFRGNKLVADTHDKDTAKEVEQQEQVQESQIKQSSFMERVATGFENLKATLTGDVKNSKGEPLSLGGIWNGIKSFFGKILLGLGIGVAGNLLVKNKDKVASWIVNLKDTITDKLPEFMENVKTTASSIWDTLKSIGEGIASICGGIADFLAKYLNDPNSSTVTKLKTTANNIAMAGVAGKIASIPGVTSKVIAGGVALTYVGIGINTNNQYAVDTTQHNDEQLKITFSDGSARTCKSLGKNGNVNGNAYGEVLYIWSEGDLEYTFKDISGNTTSIAKCGVLNKVTGNIFFPTVSPLACSDQAPGFDIYETPVVFSTYSSANGAIFVFYSKRENSIFKASTQYIPIFRIYGTDLEFVLNYQNANSEIIEFLRKTKVGDVLNGLGSAFLIGYGSNIGNCASADAVHNGLEKIMRKMFDSQIDTSNMNDSEKKSAYEKFRREHGLKTNSVYTYENKDIDVDEGDKSLLDQVLDKDIDVNSLNEAEKNKLFDEMLEREGYTVTYVNGVRKVTNSLGLPAVFPQNTAATPDPTFSPAQVPQAPFGYGSGLVSQLDPKYANKKFGNGTIATNGCAPAVATMISNQYGKGLSMNSAIADAKSYLSSNGTSIGYFNDVLSKNGIRSSLTNNASDIYSSLKNGKPAVLLGEDATNTSKAVSPFGPNPHYVMAKGIDSDGNIIVNDPETSRSTKYSPNVLRSVTGAVTTNGGASGLAVDDRIIKVAEAIVKILGNIESNTGYVKDVADNTDGIKDLTSMIDNAKNKVSNNKRYATNRSVRTSAITFGTDSMVSSLKALAQG